VWKLIRDFLCDPRNFKADAKGPPMGSNPATNSSQPLNNSSRMGANNNLNPGFNMMQPSPSSNNQMGAVMQPVQSSPLNMYTNNNVLMPATSSSQKTTTMQNQDPFGSLL